MSRFSRLTVLFILLSLLPGLLHAQKKSATKKKQAKRAPNPVYAPIKDDPSLPRVLLIGDSISIGYTLPVRALLKGQANVHRPPTNCGPTIRGLQQIDAWIGEKKWDVIHFNWGLHDLKYMSPKGQKLAKPGAEGSHQQVPPAEYEKNLRRLVARLKQTGATLIWCSTTPVPEGAAGRVVGDSVKYNGIAKKVMEENDVAIDDLYAFSLPKLKEIMRPANVHFTPDGSKQLAKQVVATIRKGLKN
ncbi:MAG: SGNH/GDSL hydrolase family protein [Pirellulaceae bacterium]|jgi:acyl-CoA thioesterase-1|nr:SGNH/GDSL hydrolase family protein [Pirellulaceae bacterium]MDP6553781.1 SGNH/GDSL hydrolase family protein [Pirellulaceae bacterium]MDP6720783.1 SGNH/GDSL hydrolase family protein [Pirellulaceae bacterium]